MLDQPNFLTFNQYRKYRLAQNDIALRYAELRQIEFGRDTETKSSGASTEPEISSAPDLSDIAPFARIKLVSPWLGIDIGPGLEEMWAVVISVEGSRVEAYIFQTKHRCYRRISVEISHVVVCVPALKPGEFDTDSTLKTESISQKPTERQEFDDDIPW